MLDVDLLDSRHAGLQAASAYPDFDENDNVFEMVVNGLSGRFASYQ